MRIPIDVTFDFTCPWCRIAEMRLSDAVDGLPPGVPLSVRWLPFELDPDLPSEGMERQTYRTLKLGTWQRSQSLDIATEAAGMADGLVFDYARVGRVPNTFAAHRLTWLAGHEGRQSTLVPALMHAYFQHGRDIGCADVLTEVAAENGMDRQRVRNFLASDEGADEVRALQAKSQSRAIRAVPHFEIGGRVVSGAQAPAVLRVAIMQAHAQPEAASGD